MNLKNNKITVHCLSIQNSEKTQPTMKSTYAYKIITI